MTRSILSLPPALLELWSRVYAAVVQGHEATCGDGWSDVEKQGAYAEARAWEAVRRANGGELPAPNEVAPTSQYAALPCPVGLDPDAWKWALEHEDRFIVFGRKAPNQIAGGLRDFLESTAEEVSADWDAATSVEMNGSPQGRGRGHAHVIFMTAFLKVAALGALAAARYAQAFAPEEPPAFDEAAASEAWEEPQAEGAS